MQLQLLCAFELVLWRGVLAACSVVLERGQLGYLLARRGACGAINLEERPAAVEVRMERKGQ